MRLSINFMKYVSTRDNKKEISFKEVFIKGLADDGGLFVPKSLKKFSEEEINNFSNLNYKELAVKIILPFCSDFYNSCNFCLCSSMYVYCLSINFFYVKRFCFASVQLAKIS